MLTSLESPGTATKFSQIQHNNRHHHQYHYNNYQHYIDKYCQQQFWSKQSSMAEGDGPSRNFRSAYYEKLGFCGNDEKNYLDLLIASSPFDAEKLSDLCERSELDRGCIESWKILLGVECGRKNPFDEYANVRRVRAEHFQLLKHHLEVLLRHNLVIKDRLKKCSNTTNTTTTTATQPNNSQQIQLSSSETSTVTTAVAATNNESENSHGHNQHKNLHDVDIQTNPGKLITLMYLLEAGRLETSDIDLQLDSEYCRKLSAMATFFVNVSNDLQEAFFLFRNFTNNILNKP